MNKTLLIAAALACSGAVAQEKQIWACQEIMSGQGFVYKDGAWAATSFARENYLITVDGLNSKYGSNGQQFSTNCEEGFFATPHIRCSDATGGTVLLNPTTKLAVISEGLGGIRTGENRDTVSIRLLQCTKF